MNDARVNHPPCVNSSALSVTSFRIGVLTSFRPVRGFSTGLSFFFNFTTLAAMSFTLAGLCLAISVLVLTWDRDIWCIKERIFAGLKHEDLEFILCCFRMNVLLVIVAVFASHGRLSKLYYYNFPLVTS